MFHKKLIERKDMSKMRREMYHTVLPLLRYRSISLFNILPKVTKMSNAYLIMTNIHLKA